MFPGMPWWSWGIIAVIAGGGGIWYFISKLKRADQAELENVQLKGQQKAEAVTAGVEREVEGEFKKTDEKDKDKPPTVNDFKF